MAACLLGFAAFLSYDELSKLCCEDLTFTDAFLQVKIRLSKTDQYRQGDTVGGTHGQAYLPSKYGGTVYGKRGAYRQVWIHLLVMEKGIGLVAH